MIHETRSIDETVAFLNELLKVDEPAIRRLVEARVLCSRALRDHPTVQTVYENDSPVRVGFLGVLNGLFGLDEQKCMGPIAAVVEGDGRISSFRRTNSPDVKKAG